MKPFEVLTSKLWGCWIPTGTGSPFPKLPELSPLSPVRSQFLEPLVSSVPCCFHLCGECSCKPPPQLEVTGSAAELSRVRGRDGSALLGGTSHIGRGASRGLSLSFRTWNTSQNFLEGLALEFPSSIFGSVYRGFFGGTDPESRLIGSGGP